MKLFSPLLLTIVLSSFLALLMLFLGIRIEQSNVIRTQQLVVEATEILIRARVEDIQNGNYRKAIEGAGEIFKTFKVELSTDDGIFSFGGKAAKSDICHVLDRTPDLPHLKYFKVCRSYDSSIGFIFVLILSYLAASLFSYFAVTRAEKIGVKRLVRLLGGVGISLKDESKLSEVIARLERDQSTINELRKREVEMAKDSIVADFARQVAHDIRSPLLALSIVNKSIARDQSDMSELLSEAVEKIKLIAQDLLPQKNNHFELSQIDVNQSIDAVVNEKRLLNPAGPQIEVVGHTEKMIGSSMLGEINFKRILSNLIQNSIESYSNDNRIGGRVVVDSTYVSGQVKVLVIDNGAGISESNIDLVFDKGFTFGKSDGNGLGLSGAKKILSQVGGTIKIVSKVRQGTEVKISFPLKVDL